MTWASAFFGCVCVICITIMFCVAYFADSFTKNLNKDDSTRTK